MKLRLLSATIAATLLAGCSSSDSPNSSTPKSGVADVVYSESLNAAFIEGDEGNSAVIVGDGNGNAAVTVNGEVFTVQGDVIVNSDGEIVGGVVVEDGIAIASINGVAYALSVEDGRLLVDVNDIAPDFGDTPRWAPEFGDDSWGPESAPTYGDIDEVFGTTVITLDNGEKLVAKDGVLYHPESDRGVVLNSDGTLTNMDGEVVGTGEMTELGFVVTLETGEEVIFRNDNGRLFAAKLGEGGHNHWGPESAPTYGDIDEVLGTTVITLDNGEKVVVKDGVLYHPESDQGLVLNDDGTITNMDGVIIGSGEMSELGFIVELNDGTEILFRNEDGRLFAAILPESPKPMNPIEGDPSIELPTLGFDLEGNTLTVTLLDGTEVTIKDNGIAGGVISGPGGNMTVSKATMDAYKEAATHLNEEEKKALVTVFLVNQSGDAIDNELRTELWKTQKESTLEWAKQSAENTAKMLHIVGIEVDEIGQDPYSLGYYLLTGKKKSIDEIKGLARDRVTNMSEDRKDELRDQFKSLSQEQRQQIKQAVKSRISSRS